MANYDQSAFIWIGISKNMPAAQAANELQPVSITATVWTAEKNAMDNAFGSFGGGGGGAPAGPQSFPISG